MDNKNLETKITEEHLLSKDAVYRFMYYRATNQEDKAKNIANLAFTEALIRIGRIGEKTIQDISKYSTLDQEEITNSFCYLAKHIPYYNYVLKLAKQYCANIEKVETTVFERVVRQLSTSQIFSSNKKILSFIENYEWNLSEKERKEILTRQYNESLMFAQEIFNRHHFRIAYNAMCCAELLENKEYINESRKIVFKQALWNKKYDLAERIANKLSEQDVKEAATTMIIINCKNSYYRSGKKIANKYVPEMQILVENIENSILNYYQILEEDKEKSS